MSVYKKIRIKKEASDYCSLELIDLNTQIKELQEQIQKLIQQRDLLLEQNQKNEMPNYFI